MASDLRRDWLGWQQPLAGGLTRRGLANGLLLTGGWFWVRVRGGCLLYRGTGRAAIDYSRPVGAAPRDATEIQEFGWIDSGGGTYWYTVRTVSGSGREAAASPAALGLAIDAAGRLIGGLPGDVGRVWAEPASGGRVRLRWRYSPACEAQRPGEFRIYHDGGTGTIDHQRPIAVVAWDLRRAVYGWMSGPYADGMRVRFAVRAANAAGEGYGAEAAVVADATVSDCPAVMVVSEVADAG